jgi:hypothetical protein
MKATASREDIEIAIARGWTVERTIAALGCTAKQYADTMAYLDSINYEPDRPHGQTTAHGTRTGYQWHRAHNQKPCDDCQLADTTYHRNRRRRTRKNAA